jgi:hypothetical protein
MSMLPVAASLENEKRSETGRPQGVTIPEQQFYFAGEVQD